MVADHGNLFEFDRGQRSCPGDLLAGVDEAGRGPLAGPVVAAAVILMGNDGLEGLNDSKKLTAAKRESLFLKIASQALVGVGKIEADQIDRLNIYQATRSAMRRALISLTRTPDKVIVDGDMRLDIPLPQLAVVKGDQKSASIAAASIIAKVCRDAWMKKIDAEYPQYLFAMHKGYPTRVHIEKLRQFGPSPIHRMSYSPVKECIPGSTM